MNTQFISTFAKRLEYYGSCIKKFYFWYKVKKGTHI